MNDSKNDSKRDQDLDLLLSEYRKIQPDDLQMQKWKSAVRREAYGSRSTQKPVWLQLAAASVVGFVVGGLVIKMTGAEPSGQRFEAVAQIESTKSEGAENDKSGATIEYSFTKND